MFKVADNEGVIVKETAASKTQLNNLCKNSNKGGLKTFQELVILKALAIKRRAMVASCLERLS